MRISDWSSDVCSSDLPGVELKKQRPGDLRWIREEFLGESGGGSAPVIPGMTVVNGHPIFEKVVELPGRIGLDTGAYRSGIRSEERRVGKDCVRTCTSRWWPSP